MLLVLVTERKEKVEKSMFVVSTVHLAPFTTKLFCLIWFFAFTTLQIVTTMAIFILTIFTIVLFKEKFTYDFQPFRIAGEPASIKKYIWKYSCKTSTFIASSIRDWFQYLFMINGVLRMESLYLANLSDLWNFTFNQKQECDQY